jgi:hypothetical protein
LAEFLGIANITISNFAEGKLFALEFLGQRIGLRGDDPAHGVLSVDDLGVRIQQSPQRPSKIDQHLFYCQFDVHKLSQTIPAVDQKVRLGKGKIGRKGRHGRG